jgi:hypothetical protein
MEHIVDNVNEICSTDRYFQFADKVVRCGRGFWHFLSLDGAELACVIHTTALRENVQGRIWTALPKRTLSGRPANYNQHLKPVVHGC